MPGRRSETEFGTHLTAATIATMPTGTLTRKIERQPVPAMSALVRTAPSTGPRTAVTPASAVNRPIAAARSCGAYMTWMLVSTCGIIAAAASPCRARNRMSASAFGASPQAADITVNATRPTTKSRLRPQRSPSREPVMRATAKASGYAATIHCSWAAVAPSPASMLGRATLTIVVSSSSIVEARNRLNSATVRARPVGRAVRGRFSMGGASMRAVMRCSLVRRGWCCFHSPRYGAMRPLSDLMVRHSGGMANTSSRTLRLLSLLQTHRFWPGPELADRLEVSERTLRRDIDRLRELGLPGRRGARVRRAGTSWGPARRCRRSRWTRTRRSPWPSRSTGRPR